MYNTGQQIPWSLWKPRGWLWGQWRQDNLPQCHYEVLCNQLPCLFQESCSTWFPRKSISRHPSSYLESWLVGSSKCPYHFFIAAANCWRGCLHASLAMLCRSVGGCPLQIDITSLRLSFCGDGFYSHCVLGLTEDTISTICAFWEGHCTEGYSPYS